MATPRKERASGKTAGEESSEANAKEEDNPVDIQDEAERRRRYRSPGLQRMRLDWRSDDAITLDRVRDHVETRLANEFADANAVIFAIFSTVRTPITDRVSGEIETDRHGMPLWEKDDVTGLYIEDFALLTVKEREHYLFQITTHLYEWERRKANAWAEAMFAKAGWEEHYSTEFDRPSHGTIEDREARGKIHASEDRYFAIMITWYSKRVDAIVLSLDRLALRLRDALTL